jgi:hypothetical protein
MLATTVQQANTPDFMETDGDSHSRLLMLN